MASAPGVIIKTIAGLVDAAALRTPSRLALISPAIETTTKEDSLRSDSYKRKWTYEELSKTTNALAGFLSLYGYEKNDILVSDFPNINENLILQIACNRIGVGYGTAKNVESMAKQFMKVKGTVSSTSQGFLAETNLPLPYLSGDFILDLIHNNNSNHKGILADFTNTEQYENDDENSSDQAHGYYNTNTPYTNQQAINHGQQSAWKLAMGPDDIVCIAVTLCHPFGIGTGVCSTLQVGGTIVLPTVGGIQGCGIPSERAKLTLQTLQSEQCTLLFADTHTIKAFEPYNIQPYDLDHLRGGVCKTGSGSEFLQETVPLAGIKLKTMGKKE